MTPCKNAITLVTDKKKRKKFFAKARLEGI